MTGYHVRLDDASTRDTRLLFCTTGILLRRLASEHHLSSVSHIVVDEVQLRNGAVHWPATSCVHLYPIMHDRPRVAP